MESTYSSRGTIASPGIDETAHGARGSAKRGGDLQRVENTTTLNVDALPAAGTDRATEICALDAPFTGNHGWFWQNLNDDAVTVTVKVTGFHQGLFRP